MAKVHAWGRERGGLPIFHVYDHPTDARDWWVVRMFLTDRPTDFSFYASELAHARTPMERIGLARMPRQPDDDPAVAETWL